MKIKTLYSLGFFALTAAQRPSITYSLGKLDDYVTSVSDIPKATGNAVYVITPQKRDGDVVIYVSEDLQKQIRVEVDKFCTKEFINGRCVHGVANLLLNPGTDIVPRFAGVAAVGGAAVAAFFAVIIQWWTLNHPDEFSPGFKFPPAKIEEAKPFETVDAAIIYTDTSKLAGTLHHQPTPFRPSVTGAEAPAITQAPASKGKSGDLKITMPEELAKAIQRLIEKYDKCPSGTKFDKEKRAPDIGAALCGAEAVVANAQQGAALGDLLILNPPRFQWAAADAAQGLVAAQNFAQEYATNLGISRERAVAVGVVGFALAWLVRVHGDTLGNVNIIPGAFFSPSDKDLCSSTAKDCVVNCEKVGQLHICGTRCATKTVCSAADKTITAEVRAWTPVGQWPMVPIPESISAAECNTNDISEIPSAWFPRIFDKFCDEVGNRDQNLAWTVDGSGNNIPPRVKLALAADPQKRAELDVSEGHMFELIWEGNGKPARECVDICKRSYKYLSESECGKVGSSEDHMTTSAKCDSECGYFSYNLVNPVRLPPQLPKPKCNPNMGRKPFTKGNIALSLITGFIAENGKKNLKHGDKPLTLQRMEGDHYVVISVSFIDGCSYVGPLEEDWQNVADPLPGVKGEKALYQTWKDCNGPKEGVGGSRVIGCLKYELAA